MCSFYSVRISNVQLADYYKFLFFICSSVSDYTSLYSDIMSKCAVKMNA